MQERAQDLEKEWRTKSLDLDSKELEEKKRHDLATEQLSADAQQLEKEKFAYQQEYDSKELALRESLAYYERELKVVIAKLQIESNEKIEAEKRYIEQQLAYVQEDRQKLDEWKAQVDAKIKEKETQLKERSVDIDAEYKSGTLANEATRNANDYYLGLLHSTNEAQRTTNELLKTRNEQIFEAARINLQEANTLINKAEEDRKREEYKLEAERQPYSIVAQFAGAVKDIAQTVGTIFGVKSAVSLLK